MDIKPVCFSSSFSGRDWRTSKDPLDDLTSTSGGGGGSANWEKEFEVLKATNKSSAVSSSKKDEWNNNFDDESGGGGGARSKRRPDALVPSTSSSSGGVDAQTKFGGAKAISSDMFFDKDERNVSEALFHLFRMAFFCVARYSVNLCYWKKTS
jgi:hypothetical protein